MAKRKSKRAPRPSAGEWRDVFLTTLATSGVVKVACHQAGITRKVAYTHRQASKDFAEAWDEALEEACDLLEMMGMERAKSKSDQLLMFFLKSQRPEKYREKVQMEHTGKVKVTHVREIIVRTRDEARAVLSGLPPTG